MNHCIFFKKIYLRANCAKHLSFIMGLRKEKKEKKKSNPIDHSLSRGLIFIDIFH